jgi:hypothetical protein
MRLKKGWETEQTTQAETRYGCFLPDLTGLARDLSAADLPIALYQVPAGARQVSRSDERLYVLRDAPGGAPQDEVGGAIHKPFSS